MPGSDLPAQVAACVQQASVHIVNIIAGGREERLCKMFRPSFLYRSEGFRGRTSVANPARAAMLLSAACSAGRRSRLRCQEFPAAEPESKELSVSVLPYAHARACSRYSGT